jgi:hypothetical protein
MTSINYYLVNNVQAFEPLTPEFMNELGQPRQDKPEHGYRSKRSRIV